MPMSTKIKLTKDDEDDYMDNTTYQVMSSLTVTYTSIYSDSEPLRFQWVPEYPEYLVPSDDEVPIEDEPLRVDASPIALSPGYIANSDSEEDPKEDLADGGDDDDDEEEEEASEEEEDDEEEEYLALTDSFVVPINDPVLSAKDTEAFETDESAPIPPSPRHHRARIYVRLPPPMTASMEACIDKYAATPTPPSPPLSSFTPLLSPFPQIPS
nr:hypothetical protein [Tanacetum cinerariifolium]